MIVGEYASLLPMHGGLTPSGTCYSRESFLELGGFVNVDIMLAPSDITTMLHLALNGFSFEMIDEMIFIRRGASTMTNETQASKFLEAYDNAYLNFIKITSKDDIKNLISISTQHNEKPFYFYYSLAQDSNFKRDIKRVLVLYLMC
jgi:hypothetical protein